MLEIKELHARVKGIEILHGINLLVNQGEIHALMGPNGSGKSTLAQIISGNDNYEVTSGEIIYQDKNLLEMSPEERARAGIFMSFQYPIEIPGVNSTYFLRTALNEIRKSNGLEELDAFEFLSLAKEKLKIIDMDESFLKRAVNEGFSGGEKKKYEIYQMAMLEPRLAILDEIDSGLDIDALRIVADSVNMLYNKERSILIVTHYQRLLDHIIPDHVHVMLNGRIVQSGQKELAKYVEEKGYEGIKRDKGS